MPLYDYRCSNCSYEEEVLQGINDQPLTQCPSCAEQGFRRKASAPAFTFKGGGWYKDLYGSAGSGSKKETSSTSTSESSTSTSTSTSSDSSSSKPSASTTPASS